MNNGMTWKQWLAGGAAALILTTGVAAAYALNPQTANAQSTGDTTVTARAGRMGNPLGGFGQRGGKGAMNEEALAKQLGITLEKLQAAQQAAHTAAHSSGSDMRDALAKELGITVDALDAAQSAVAQAQLDQALADGTITQEQYDLQQARQALRDYVNPKAITAKVLGMTEAEMETARADGKRLSDLIEAAGMDEASFRTATDAATEAAIQQAVTDGVITAAQADLVRNAPQRGGPGFGSDDGLRMGLDGGQRGAADGGAADGGPGFGPGRGAMGAMNDEALAKELGVTVEKLQAAQTAAHTAAHSSGSDMRDALAKELGITVDALDAAQSAVAQAQLDQALADGTITQEQYDLQQARQALRSYVNPKAITAKVLGMTEAELETARADGKRLSDLIEAAGMDEASFRTATDAATEAAIQQAVTDGVITAAQADLVRNAPEPGRGGRGDGLRMGPDGDQRGAPGFGPGRGHRGGGRGGEQQSQPDVQPTEPSTPDQGANG